MSRQYFIAHLHTQRLYDEANLAAIETIRSITGCEVGWSDHTVNSGIIHRAINRWDAKVIEFHLDLDGKGAEFKSGHCWLPEQIGSVIKHVREGKRVMVTELKSRFYLKYLNAHGVLTHQMVCGHLNQFATLPT